MRPTPEKTCTRRLLPILSLLLPAAQTGWRERLPPEELAVPSACLSAAEIDAGLVQLLIDVDVVLCLTPEGAGGRAFRPSRRLRPGSRLLLTEHGRAVAERLLGEEAKDPRCGDAAAWCGLGGKRTS